jgi:catechol 2,3-dioxygenase-like lactoylglutathione lyase family enzyme
MDRAVAYYTDVLGFRRKWGDSGFSELCRGDANIMLACGDQGLGKAWLYVGADDVDALHAEILPRGAMIRQGPVNYPWGARELHVEDLDGNVLRFGAEATDEPFGQWVDQSGIRWNYDPHGSVWRSE